MQGDKAPTPPQGCQRGGHHPQPSLRGLIAAFWGETGLAPGGSQHPAWPPSWCMCKGGGHNCDHCTLLGLNNPPTAPRLSLGACTGLSTTVSCSASHVHTHVPDVFAHQSHVCVHTCPLLCTGMCTCTKRVCTLMPHSSRQTHACACKSAQQLRAEVSYTPLGAHVCMHTRVQLSPVCKHTCMHTCAQVSQSCVQAHMHAHVHTHLALRCANTDASRGLGK